MNGIEILTNLGWAYCTSVLVSIIISKTNSLEKTEVEKLKYTRTIFITIFFVTISISILKQLVFN